jgi:hypothetical protein
MEDFNIKLSKNLISLLNNISKEKSEEENKKVTISDLIEESIIEYYNISIIDIKNEEKIFFPEIEEVEFEEINNMNHPYYVYAYLDPDKKGVFQYEEYYFNHEPFYIGKGSSKRYASHLTETHNKDLSDKIKSLDKKPIIIKIESGLSKKEAYLIENNLINIIGKKIDKKGPLYNKISGKTFLEKNIERTFLDIESMKYLNILKALNKHKNIKKASSELGISERTLYRKIKNLKIKKNKETNLYHMEKK